MPGRSRGRRIALIGFVALAAALAILHVRYPLPYVYRVIVFQGPDFTDFERFPASAIEASAQPRPLEIVPDTRVATAIEEFAQAGDLEAFLRDTETTAFVAMHRGKLVEERYLLGHDRNAPQNTFSVSKSITSTLVGLAIRDGFLEFEAPITRYLPELGERDPRFAEITIENLLDMRSGIRFSDEVSFPFITADTALIYYSTDLESIVLNRTSIAAPPGEFQYNNYNPPMLGAALRRVTGMSPSEYLERELWDLLGATGPAGWTVDDRGFERMEAGFHARARDLVRFGQLYLDRGSAAGRDIVPASWVDETTTVEGPWDLDAYDGRSWGYRGGWWIVPRETGLPDFCAIGHFGQFIYVSPQHDSVFVRTGPGRGSFGDRDWTELFFFVAERLSAAGV